MAEAKAVEAPTALARLIEEYLAACRARGLAIRTVREAYRYPLMEVFLPFCADEGIEEPGQVTKRMLDRLTTRLLDEGGKKDCGAGSQAIPLARA